jgi:protein gp37
MASRLWSVQWGPDQLRKRFLNPAEALKAMDRKAQKSGEPLSVFHNSLSDMFDNAVPDAWRMDAFQAMADTPNLIHLVLTKRIGNVRPYTQRDGLAFDLIGDGRVQLGATICNQAEADRDIPKLLAVPAARRFLSVEPLLGSVSFEGMFANTADIRDGTNMLEMLDWVIVGGESGPQARPMHPDWAWDLKNQCEAAGVPFLFKQWGEWMPESAMSYEQRMKDMGQLECLYVKLDGSTHWVDEDDHTPYDASDVRMVKVGKKAAGRLLYGRTWDGAPA